MVGNDTAEEDPGVEQEGRRGTEASADEDVGALGGVGEADQSVEYITHFTKAVELYEKKNKNCFRCGALGVGAPSHMRLAKGG